MCSVSEGRLGTCQDKERHTIAPTVLHKMSGERLTFPGSAENNKCLILEGLLVVVHMTEQH